MEDSSTILMWLADSVSFGKSSVWKNIINKHRCLRNPVDKSIRGNKKLELRVSIKLFIESEISYFYKSTLKSPRRKSLLNHLFCNFLNKEEIESFVKSFIGSVGCICMQPTITWVNLNIKSL